MYLQSFQRPRAPGPPVEGASVRNVTLGGAEPRKWISRGASVWSGCLEVLSGCVCSGNRGDFVVCEKKKEVS